MMSKSFELETLRIRLNDADFQCLDLHQRIQRALRALILEGVLASNVKLPATRSLATSLAVARDTVENAYGQLHRDGFIVRRKGSGSYVSERVGSELRGAARRRVKLQDDKRKAREPGASLSQRGRAIFASNGVADQQEIRAFATGLPETRNFPSMSGSACNARC
ncbi:GntR family transcriptional regulator [Serratia sp. L9]|uniref:GntR family transcriptional regulator n=1 Tax=Serratia sp. L9 TaxID=3423946 RepID=UPI003D66F1F2